MATIEVNGNHYNTDKKRDYWNVNVQAIGGGYYPYYFNTLEDAMAYYENVKVSASVWYAPAVWDIDCKEYIADGYFEERICYKK